MIFLRIFARLNKVTSMARSHKGQMIKSVTLTPTLEKEINEILDGDNFSAFTREALKAYIQIRKNMQKIHNKQIEKLSNS
jgi:metal-responsive CopG/Arc/MetJ family transcriptional regulator